MRIQLIIVSILLASLSSLAQKENKHIRKGNELYLQKKYDEAEVEYRKALEKNNKATNAQYNLSNALYKQKRYKEASTILDELATKTKDPQELSRLYHNLGNAMLEEKDYQNSIEAYKKSLKHNPNAEDTRYNLSYAMKKMQRQEQEQQKQKQKHNQPNDPNPKKDPNKDQKPNNQKQEQQKQQLNRDEAEQMLDALNRNEKELRKKTDKQKGKDGVPASGKEW
jgi:Ca-activated chloride channel family protein